MIDCLAESIKNGERRALAKAITLIESAKEADIQQSQQLLQALMPNTGNSIRIGITGIPGVGKSTFIDSFGQYLIDLGQKIAVLAVDPSSPVAGGSILGDKIRMQALSKHSNAFIRPSPSSGTLGGVARKTRETLLLCEAAGFDVILVETVGVGQSEYCVASMVDFFMVLMLPNAGDEIQGIKKGIIELADALIINKADGDSQKMALDTQNHYQNAIQLLHHENSWKPPVLTCSALKKYNIEAIWEMLQNYRDIFGEQLASKRTQQKVQWFERLITELLEQRINTNITALKSQLSSDVATGKITPTRAAYQVVNSLLSLPDIKQDSFND